MIWFALLLAQSLGGGLVDLIANLTEAMAHPFRVRWTDRSLVTILIVFTKEILDLITG